MVRRKNLRFRFLGWFLLLLLCLFRPWWHDTVYARVGDGLAEVFAIVPCDHDEGTAQCCLTVEHFLRLVRVRIAEGENGAAKMREGILQGFDEFRLVGGE